MAKKKILMTSTDKDTVQSEHSCVTGGDTNGTARLKNSWKTSYKVKQTTANSHF